MNTTRMLLSFSTGTLAFLLLASSGSLAEARHLKLYNYDVLDKGATGLTYNLDVVKSPGGDSNLGTPILHELELEHGFTSRWTQSLYIDYDQLSGKVNEITSIKTEINYAFWRRGEMPVDFRLNIEFAKAIGSHVDAFDSKDTADTIEFRPIFDKQFQKFSVVFGPIVSKALAAPNDAPLGGWELAFANAVMIPVNDILGINLELHSFMGEFSNVAKFSEQQHFLVPNVDYSPTDFLTVSGGVGVGLTSASDDFTFRLSVASAF